MTEQVWTTGSIARLVEAECDGPDSLELRGVASLTSAGADELSFCAGGRWSKLLPGTGAGAVIARPGEAVPSSAVPLWHDNPRLAYAKAASAMVPLVWGAPGVHPTASVHPTAMVDPTASVGPFAVIDEGAVVGPGSWVMAHAYVGQHVRVGTSCRLMPHAVVMERCTMGDCVWLLPGAVVGADGFGHVPTPDGPIRVPQLGTVVLEDGVEVGANACVDRAALDETRVGRGTKLDNLVQVAHGVRIGASCLIAAFAGIAGGARLGDGVVMAGRTAVIDAIDVGDGAVFAALASAMRNVPKGRRIGGSPARRYFRWLRETAAVQQLPGLLRTVEGLERRVQDLEAK